MKKFLSLFFFLFLTSFIFSATYQIAEVNYQITPSKIAFMGKTSVYALEQNVKLDKSIIFESEKEFLDYLDLYKQNLNNLRAFDEIFISYDILTIDNSSDINDEIIRYDVNVCLTDSLHILGLPHIISYNSNEGWKPKLKLKDTNFLGTLNTLSTDFFFILDFENNGASNAFGFNFDFDYPFKAGIFDAKLINDYTLSYNFKDPSPEWNLTTGLKLTLPLDLLDVCFEFKQNETRNFDYLIYGDETYFAESLKLSFPFYILQTNNYGTLTYTPYISAKFNWDFDGISIENSNLSSPSISIAQEASFGKLNWYKTMRKGFTLSSTNSYNYNFQRNLFYPYLDLKVQGSYFISLLNGNILNKVGFNFRNFDFFYFENKNNQYFYGTAIGSYLRGIRDTQYFGNDTPSSTTSDALIFNLDIPIHLFTLRFDNRFLKYFSCEVQLSPFVDIALTKNRHTERMFSLKDGFYSSGFEILVYPQKWSSFTVRGSLGLDIGKLLLSDYIDTSWRSKTSFYEITLGLGLFY